MIRFNAKGMMVFPCPNQTETDEEMSIIVVQECFCQNEHNLVSKKANFSGFDGVFLKVKTKNNEGFIAISPICGDKSRISLDIELVEGEQIKLFCPECDVELPVYSKCECGGDLITLFSSKEIEYSDCISICNVIGCQSSVIRKGGKHYSATKLQPRWK